MRRQLSFARQLAPLPPRVALFQWRARRLAERAGDRFALASGTRPHNLRVLLDVAEGSVNVVELGTGSAWTSLSLLLADGRRSVISYDPVTRSERERYLRLAGSSAARRLTLVSAPGAVGPDEETTVDLLYVDSSHDREETIREVQVWHRVLKEGSLIVFDDYVHPGYPGVAEAIAVLGLDGRRRGDLFVHRVAGNRATAAPQ